MATEKNRGMGRERGGGSPSFRRNGPWAKEVDALLPRLKALWGGAITEGERDGLVAKLAEALVPIGEAAMARLPDGAREEIRRQGLDNPAYTVLIRLLEGIRGFDPQTDRLSAYVWTMISRECQDLRRKASPRGDPGRFSLRPEGFWEDAGLNTETQDKFGEKLVQILGRYSGECVVAREIQKCLGEEGHLPDMAHVAARLNMSASRVRRRWNTMQRKVLRELEREPGSGRLWETPLPPESHPVAGSPAVDHDHPSPPGTLFHVRPPSGTDILIQWMVADHDGDLVLMVPLDDHPLAGPGDVRLPIDRTPWPMVARCGLAARVPAIYLRDCCTPAGRLPATLVDGVLVGLAGLSPMGPPPADGGWDDPDDPDLQERLGLVCKCLDDLLERSGNAGHQAGARQVIRMPARRFGAGYPRECHGTRPRLAAAGPGGILEELERLEAAAEEGCRTLEHPLLPGVTLVLMANDRGVLPAVRGRLNREMVGQIRDLTRVDSGVPLTWEPAGGLLVSRRRLEWSLGRVILGLPGGGTLELLERD
jgi:hypothetical protein